MLLLFDEPGAEGGSISCSSAEQAISIAYQRLPHIALVDVRLGS